MFHLGYITSPLNQPNALKPGLSRDYPNAGPTPKASWQLLVGLLLMMGILSSFMVLFSIREQQEPNFCLPHPHLSHSHALTHEESGDSPAFLPLTEHGGPAATLGACPSSPPYQQLPTPRDYSGLNNRTCRHCPLPHFH